MNNLKECIEALKDVRCGLESDADPRTVKALDEAIAELESCLVASSPDRIDPTEAVLKALTAIANIVTCVEGMAELMRSLGS